MTALFDAITLGDLELPNRIIMAPLTRGRASSTSVSTRTVPGRPSGSAVQVTAIGHLRRGADRQPASRPRADLLLKVLDLALQGIEAAGGLPTERIELLHRGACRSRRWTIVRLTLEHQYILRQAL